MTTDHAALQEFLYRALGEPVGLALATPDPAKARQLLYAERNKLGDPALGALQFRLVTLDGESVVAIVKGAAMPQAMPYEPLGGASPDLGDLDL